MPRKNNRKPAEAPRQKPVWTDVRLQAPMLGAAQLTCATILARPPQPVPGFGVKHCQTIVAAAKAGQKLIADEWETIARIESSGAAWRLRVPIKSAAQLSMTPDDHAAMVDDLIAAGWLALTGGAGIKISPRYELRDPR